MIIAERGCNTMTVEELIRYLQGEAVNPEWEVLIEHVPDGSNTTTFSAVRSVSWDGDFALVLTPAGVLERRQAPSKVKLDGEDAADLIGRIEHVIDVNGLALDNRTGRLTLNGNEAEYLIDLIVSDQDPDGLLE